MKITVVTLFPEMIVPFFSASIIKKAQEKKLVQIDVVNLRDFAIDTYKTVDDKPYGGGAGMVIRVDCIKRAIDKVRTQKSKVVLTSPRGTVYNQSIAQRFAKLDHLVLIAGHYEGFDARAERYIDEEVSLGDFVMTGGEIVAAAIVDSVVRLIGGVLKKSQAIEQESFFEIPVKKLIDIVGNDGMLDTLIAQGIKTVLLLEYPHYTRPEEFDGQKVPEVLLSGHHDNIEKWRIQKAYETTIVKRPDLLSVA